MSDLKGTNIAAPIVPFTGDDTYPTHYSKYGKGGFKSVSSIAERDNIPIERLEPTTLCYVKETGLCYEWDSNLWTESKIGGKGDKGDKGDSIGLYVIGSYATLDDLIKEYPCGPADNQNGFFKAGDSLYMWVGDKYEPLNLNIYRTFDIEQFTDISPINGNINIDYSKFPYSKVTLSGDNKIYNLYITNIRDGSCGKILVFQTGFKQVVAANNIKGTIDLPLNANTIALLSYNVIGDTIYIHSNAVLGDVQYPTPQRIMDFDATYYDNSVCSVIWSAPYANNIYDKATEYDMRYANSEVDANDPIIWNGLRKVEPMVVPAAPGEIQRMVITKLEANKEYYIYLKSVKVNYGVKYISAASNPVYCKTKGGMSDGGGYYRLDLRSDMLYPSKRNVKMVDGILCSLEGAIDEQEKDVYLSDGYIDTKIKTYETGWEPRISAIDNPYELTIDLHSCHVLDRMYLYCKTKSLYRLFISSDYGSAREYVSTSDRIYNGFVTIDLKGKQARFIHLQYDDDIFAIQEDVSEGEEVYPTRNNSNSVAGIHCLRLYGRQATDRPSSLLPPARRAITDRTMDEFFCTNGHFYQQGRIHSKCSGSRVRLYGAFGHFGPSPAETDYNQIADYCIRSNQISWVYGNNGLEVYLRDMFKRTYSPFGLLPIITGTAIIDYCRWPGYGEGKKQNKQIDNYWLPEKWAPLPSKGVRGFEKYFVETMNPQNYKTLAKTCNHLAAIYGDTAVPADQLDVYPPEESKESGLNLVSSIEFDNEPDKTWEGWMGYTQPEEFAAQISAVYDGHCGTLADETGNTSKYGIRQVNSKQVTVSPGMCGINTGYIRSAYEWCKRHRKDGKFPIDVLNFHSYFSNIGNQAGDNTIPIQYAVTFEEALKGEASEFNKIDEFRNRFLPDKEIWITEFGYGEAGGRNTQSKYQCYTQPGRKVGSFVVPDRHRSDVKGAWTLRAILGMLDKGVSLVNYYSTEMEGSYFGAGNWDSGAGYEMFHWNDCNDLTPGAKAEAIKKYEHGYGRGGFSTTGLFGPILGCGAFPISRAYWWIATFRNRLKGYIYTGRKYLDDDRVSIACFRKVGENKGAYIVWMNSAENNGISDVEIPLPVGVQHIMRVDTFIPELVSPENLPNSIVYDQPRTSLPTSRREKYIGGNWMIQNKKPDGKVYESFSQAPAIYPPNPKEGDMVTVLPTKEENPYFPIVGPVGGKKSLYGQNPGANQYERIDPKDPTNADGSPKWGTAYNVYLAWRQVDAVCDYIDYTEDGQHGQRGDESILEALRNCIVDNVTEFPVYYLFDATPDPDYKSNITDLSGNVINSSSVKLYWNNYNTQDTGYEVFVSELPETGYEPFREMLAEVENSITITGLSPNTTYYFKVRAKCGNKVGDLSDYTSIKTFSELPAPTDFHSNSNSATSITLAWNYVAGQVSDFVYYSIYRADSSGMFAIIGKVEDISVHSYIDDNLTIGTTYKYKIRAVGLNGQSDYSDELEARTMLAEECPPVLMRAITDKMGRKIVLTFNLAMGVTAATARQNLTLTENGDLRLISAVSRDDSNPKNIIVFIPENTLKDYDKKTDVRISYSGSVLLSEYGVSAEAFSNIKVMNVIGNFTNIETSYKLNFCATESPKPESSEWNNIAGNPETEIVSVKLTDIYGRNTDVTLTAIQEKPKYVWSTPVDSGVCEIEGIEQAVYKYGWRGPNRGSLVTENIIARLRLSGLNDERRYTVKHFGATLYGADLLAKMKINNAYAGPLAQKGNKTTFLVIEDCQPKDGILDIDIINATENTMTGTGYPFTAFMLIDEFRSGTEPENTDVWIRQATVNGIVDGVVKDPHITVHLNCIGTATAYRISEQQDMTGVEWINIVNDNMDVAYTLSEEFGKKILYVQVKNLYVESNTRVIELEYKDPYVPLVLRNVYINRDAGRTYGRDVNIMFDKDGTPSHYKLSESSDLSAQEWAAWPDPAVSELPFTLSDGSGQKTVYAQIMDSITLCEPKADTINYIPISRKNIELTITVPPGTDTNAVNASFPVLKYNKKMIFTYTADDGPVGAYGKVWSAINKKWVDDERYYHIGQAKSTGYIPTKTLGYTDGCGVEHRMPVGVAVWPNCGSNGIKFMDDNPTSPSKYPYILWKELTPILDFGGEIYYHNVNQDTWNKDLPSDIIKGLKEDQGKAIAKLGRGMKVMMRPDGNNNYLTAVTMFDDIVMSFAENTPAVYLYPNADPDLFKSVGQRKMYTDDNVAEMAWVKGIHESGNPVWAHLFTHTPIQTIIDFLTTLNNTYGKDGDDSIWFATVDEVYEYWFVRKNSILSKTVDGNKVKFMLSVPVDLYYYHQDLCLNIDGINGLEGVTVNVSDSVYGCSFTMNNGKLLVNMNYDEQVISRAEKYTAKFASSEILEDKDDALYFVSMLRDLIAAPYLARIEAVTKPPVLLEFDIYDTQTQSRDVVIYYATDERATHYMISESPTFEGATWMVVGFRDVTFRLSNITGIHTLYCKLKNQFGESNVKSDQITYNPPALSLSSVKANGGNTTCSSRSIRIDLTYTGVPTYYRIGEKSDLSLQEWQPIADRVEYMISEGFGAKTIYLQLKDSAGTFSNVASAAIEYVELIIKTIISLNSGSKQVEYDTETGEVINLLGIARNASFPDLQLKDNAGNISGIYLASPTQYSADENTPGYSFASPTVDDTGVYPAKYIKNYMCISGKSTPAMMSTLRFSQFALGTYKVRILSSASSNAFIAENQYISMFYKVNGVISTLWYDITNNKDKFIEFDNIPVESDGMLSISFYNTINQYYRPGVNIIEIIKKG